MNTRKYDVFRRFPTLEQAQEIAKALKENGFDCKILDNSPQDIIAFPTGVEPEVQIFLPPSDFEKATSLLEEKYEQFFDELDKDYYLFSFDNQELFDVLSKPDMWSAFDYNLAQKLLIERGEKVDDALLSQLKNARLAELSQPENDAVHLLFIGYFFAFMGGIIGISMGYYLWKYKKLLPNGERKYEFSENYRLHGERIFIIGMAVLVVAIYLKISNFQFDL